MKKIIKTMRRLLKIKEKTVRLVVSSIGGTYLYTGTIKETNSSIKMRQVVAGKFTGNIFTFSKSLIKIRNVDNIINYYIDEQYITVD
jgi:hypothetical protein